MTACLSMISIMNTVVLRLSHISTINENAKRALVSFNKDAPASLMVMYLTTHLSDLTKIRFEKWHSVEWGNPGNIEGVINENMVKLHGLIKKLTAPDSDLGMVLKLDTFISSLVSYDKWTPVIWLTEDGTNASATMNPFGLDLVADLLGYMFNKFVVDK